MNGYGRRLGLLPLPSGLPGLISKYLFEKGEYRADDGIFNSDNGIPIYLVVGTRVTAVVKSTPMKRM